MSFAIGPTVSSCVGAIGYTPSIGTNPNVVFRPTTPQSAAGIRIEPAESVPKATSASSFATATAEPLDDPPGIKLSPQWISRVCRNSHSYRRQPPPTLTGWFFRQIARHAGARSPDMSASRFAGELCLARNSEPAVVTTPFMSIRSFTASRSFLFPGGGGQYSMNARSRVALTGRAFGIAQPLSQLIECHPGQDRPGSRAAEHDSKQLIGLA